MKSQIQWANRDPIDVKLKTTSGKAPTLLLHQITDNSHFQWAFRFILRPSIKNYLKNELRCNQARRPGRCLVTRATHVYTRAVRGVT